MPVPVPVPEGERAHIQLVSEHDASPLETPPDYAALLCHWMVSVVAAALAQGDRCALSFETHGQFDQHRHHAHEHVLARLVTGLFEQLQSQADVEQRG